MQTVAVFRLTEFHRQRMWRIGFELDGDSDCRVRYLEGDGSDLQVWDLGGVQVAISARADHLECQVKVQPPLPLQEQKHAAA